jgi:hypothetical protein
MYAIQNIVSGKFVYGTDKRYHPYHQRTSQNQMLTYDSIYAAKSDFLHRQCGKDYKIAVLKTIKVKRLIEPPKNYADLIFE